MNSERHLYNAVTTAISRKKLLDMESVKEGFFINFDLTETGEIINIRFSLDKETLITPDEVANGQPYKGKPQVYSCKGEVRCGAAQAIASIHYIG